MMTLQLTVNILSLVKRKQAHFAQPVAKPSSLFMQAIPLK